MPLVFDEVKGNIVTVRASGLLTDEDYETFVPQMEALFERWGRLRMLFQMTRCRGWDPASLWDELSFQLRHRHDMKRVAVVGSKKWAEWAARLSKLLTGSEVRYFDGKEADEARAWIESGW